MYEIDKWSDNDIFGHITEQKYEQMWQNANNGGISVEDIQMFVVLFFQPLCVYENFHNNKLRGGRIVIFI